MRYFYKVFPLQQHKPLTYGYHSEIELLTYVEIPLGEKKLRGLVISKVDKSKFDFDPKKLRSISRVLPLYLPVEYYRSAVFIKNYYFQPLSTTLNFFKPFQKNRVSAKEIKSREINLSQKQSEALEELKTSSPALLFGDTGSGKTHIYLKLIEETLQRGEDVIFLLPEINLVPQTFSRVAEYFGDTVTSWHSKVRGRKEILKEIYLREKRVVVGTLSSLFLPLQKVGLIIVDEEHSSSYSLSGGVGFNGREMAIYLAQQLKVKAVLGSATPSVNSYHKFKSVRLKGKFHQSRNRVEFLDFKEIPDTVLQQIDERLKAKEQIIVFVPIRGNFKTLKCKDCGERLICPNCSVDLTLYSSKSSVQCNRCGYEKSSENLSCSSCNSDEVQSEKEGTVEVAKKLQTLFPEASIKNFDSDSSKESGIEEILKDFRERKIDILVGTQMISKGHDYPDVTLSLILGIDRNLNSSDFQAYEKSLSLLIQVAGRSGRKKESLTVIQTKNRELFSKYIGDYEQFLKDELSIREGRFPPFINFIKILITHSSKDRAEEIQNHIELFFILFAPFEIFISGISPVEKIEKKFRFQMVIKSLKLKEDLSFIKESLEQFPTSFKKHLTVEINPNEYI